MQLLLFLALSTMYFLYRYFQTTAQPTNSKYVKNKLQPRERMFPFHRDEVDTMSDVAALDPFGTREKRLTGEIYARTPASLIISKLLFSSSLRSMLAVRRLRMTK